MSGLAVAVVAGGPSAEANVSRTSARGVQQALESAGHRTALLELDADLSTALRGGGFDVVFPITHGPLGEDGCLQGLLEVLDLPYVGSGVLASALAASKPHAKTFFRRAGLPVAEELVLEKGTDRLAAARRARELLGPGVVVKPASGGSAIATSRVRAEDDDSAFVRALDAVFDIDGVALVERFVVGREVTCGVLEEDTGPMAFPPTLVLSKAADWYDFTARYAAGGSEHRCPAPLPASVNQRVQEIAVAAFRALGCRDLGRVDFVVGDASDETAVTLLEVNTLPGMTATSLYPEAASYAGIAFPALCDRLARRAHGRPRRLRPAELPMP